MFRSKYEAQPFRRMQLATKKWYFIVINHVYHFLTKSEATIFVDGKLTDSVNLLYPKSELVSKYSTNIVIQ